MSDEEKVISLDQRRKARSEAETEEKKESPKGEVAQDEKPLPGRLVWLYCPVCETYQYTEVVMSGGRVHNPCGTQVEEVEVEIDVRSELTLAEFNLDRLRDLSELLAAERSNYEEYRKRLQLVAGRSVSAYTLDETILQRLPVAEISPLGLLVPKALAFPAERFKDESATTDDSTDPKPAPEPDGKSDT